MSNGMKQRGVLSMKTMLKNFLVTFVQWVIFPVVIGIDKILQEWFGIILLRCHRDVYIASLTAEEKKELLLPHLVEPFRLICEASPYLEKKANILGRFVIREWLKRAAETRVGINKEVKNRPEILEVPIKRPIFIATPCRTGSTLLHELFGADPNMRIPLSFEVENPVPLPEDPNIPVEQDVRYKKSWEFAFFQELISPSTKVLHDLGPLIEGECMMITIRCFLQDFTEIIFGEGLKEYGTFINNTPRAIMDKVYEEHKLNLQVIGFHSGMEKRRFVLKNNDHVRFMDSILSVYPDASFVWIHRKLSQVIGSNSSHRVTNSIMAGVNPDKLFVGRETERQMGIQIDCAVDQARALSDDVPHTHILYTDLVKDPVGVMKGLYEKFGAEFTEATAEGIRKYLNSNPQGKNGKHRYTLEEYGVSKESLKVTFKKYLDFAGELFPGVDLL